MKKQERISGRRLEELAQALSERDQAILRSLRQCRYLTTGQIARLHFDSSATHPAAIRATSRSLAKLQDYGLVGALTRRIGGVRAGSGAFVWSLAPAGFRLLNLGRPGDLPRKHFREPTPHFLEHTLLIAEARLQLAAICQKRGLTLSSVQLEPECWRWYPGKGGKRLALKADLFAITQGDGYEDCWFVEIDRATETPARVLEKCDRYLHYLRFDAEREPSSVFPYVVWLVPSAGRKASLRAHISKQYAHGPNIFVAITPDELETLIVEGAAEYLQKIPEKTNFKGESNHDRTRKI